MKKSGYLLVMVLLMGSCAPSTESPTSVYVATQPIISTITLIPTTTKLPTFTLTVPTATISVTPTPSYASTVTSPEFGLFPTWRICDGAIKPNYENDLSPDGNWLAVSCQPADLSKFVGTKITQLHGTTIWEVSFYDLYGIYQKSTVLPEGIQDGEMQVVHWTMDGNYVYLNPDFCCVDVPQNIFFSRFQNSLGIYRLDLLSGEITATLQPFRGDMIPGYVASFSPSGKYLVYVIAGEPRNVHIYNLQTGDTFIITLDEQYIASGLFEWSQDSKRAIFVAAKASWSDWETSISNGISYYLLDLKTLSSLHLFDQPDIYRVSWTQDGNIILHQASGEDGLLYDFQSNTFTVVTPTPKP